MKVSIVTVVYNAEFLLEQTIKSVLNQSYENIEYIIIDGASTDKTIDIIKKYEDKISYWVSEPDNGIYYAMNKAIEKASGKYINFMNAGDTFTSFDTVEYVTRNINDDSQMIYGNHRKIQSDILKKAKNIDNWHTIMPFCHQTLFAKTSLMKEYPFDTHYKLAADLDFIYKMTALDKIFCYVDKEVARFDESGFAKTNEFLMHIESINILLKYNIDIHEIKRSWWFRSLRKEFENPPTIDMLLKPAKSELESDDKRLFNTVDFFINTSIMKHPIDKYTRYKELVGKYDLISEKKRKNSIGHAKYSIVSAVYNAEIYLDTYISTLVKQTLDFKKNIFLILVDDGSTDKSEDIIQSWILKYPKNITCLKKENGGVSSARNLGLKYVKTPWVTFIDSDDFVNDVYFEKIDYFLKDNKGIDIISTNQVFYIEDTDEVKEHYLSYRFKKGDKVFKQSDMKGYIQSTVNSVFFKTKLISDTKTIFDLKVKPLNEDGHFFYKLLLNYTDLNIAFLQEPVYYYRKRLANDSLVNTSWNKASRYDDVLQFGLLDICKSYAEKYSKVPEYVQRYVIYHLFWYFKKMLNSENIIDILTNVEKEKFDKLLKEIFTYLDAQVIDNCGLGGMTHKYRMGIYNLYKNQQMLRQVVYIDSFNRKIGELELYYYTFYPDNKVSLELDFNEMKPSKIENEAFFMMDKVFIYKKNVTFHIEDNYKYLEVILDDVKTEISINKKRYKGGVTFSIIEEYFNK